jgi:hypothetical protein
MHVHTRRFFIVYHRLFDCFGYFGGLRIIRKPVMSDQKKSRRAMLEDLVAKNPDDAFTRYGLAMECMNSGDGSVADTHFRHLVEHNADYVPAYLMYGQFLARESRNEEARQILTTGISAATKANNQHARSEMEALLNELS